MTRITPSNIDTFIVLHDREKRKGIRKWNQTRIVIEGSGKNIYLETRMYKNRV